MARGTGKTPNAPRPAVISAPPGGYPQVDRSHIVPASYLRNFTANDQIEIRLPNDPAKRIVTSVKNAGVSSRAYSRTRPDGSRIDDIEHCLSQIEGPAAPVLRELQERWPLETEEKAMLGEYFAYQSIRGPRWKRWHETFTQKYIDDHRRAIAWNWPAQAISTATLEATAKHLLGDTARGMKMLDLGPKIACIFASMHWTLVEFKSPVLATSDHPVVVWPLAARSRAPRPNEEDIGLLDTLEAWVPINPQCAILMTWADAKDTDLLRVKGARQHAATFNAFTIAQADAQWFCLPGTSPPVGAGMLLPVSPQMLQPYSPAHVMRSRRRAATAEKVSKLIGRRDLEDRTFEVVTLS